MSKKLIAMVATAVMVEGVRTVIQPGEELPDLTKHDERELLASGAAKNPQDDAAGAKADTRAEAATQRIFDAARKRAADADASTAVDLKTSAGALPVSRAAAKAITAAGATSEKSPDI